MKLLARPAPGLALARSHTLGHLIVRSIVRGVTTTRLHEQALIGVALSHDPFLPLLLHKRRRDRRIFHLVRFPGLPQGSKTLHIAPNLGGLPLQICHRPLAFFVG
jgi:hypothetical protein